MNRLKVWRLQRVLSQIELAQAAGIPRYVIQLAESGIRMPNDDQINALDDSLGVRKEDLFGAITENVTVCHE